MEIEIQKINRKLDFIIEEVKKLNKEAATGESHFGIREAANKLNLSVSRVYTLIYEGKLKPLQRSKYSRIQFNQEILNKYIHESKQ
jgi:hypothetical protein